MVSKPVTYVRKGTFFCLILSFIIISSLVGFLPGFLVLPESVNPNFDDNFPIEGNPEVEEGHDIRKKSSSTIDEDSIMDAIHTVDEEKHDILNQIEPITNPGSLKSNDNNTFVSDGTVDDFHKISDITGNFSGDPDSFLSFGRSIAGIGDLDGDSNVDLAVGTDMLSEEGGVWILFLQYDGTVKSEQIISETQGSFNGSLDKDDYFGLSVTNLGDIDGDGVTDLAVGAEGDDDGCSPDDPETCEDENDCYKGAVWILFMNSNGTVKSEKKISETVGNFTGVLDNVIKTTGDGFGSSVTNIGDLDGDGTTDIAVGASWDGENADSYKGALWILFMNDNGTVKSNQKISNNGTQFEKGRLGRSVANVGDLDLDNVTDLVMGVDRLVVLFMNNDGTVKSFQRISTIEGIQRDLRPAPYGDIGASVANIGDMDSDGFIDLIAGEPYDADGGGFSEQRGAIWILFLGNDSTSEIYGKKWEDLDGNGIIDPEEPYLGHWEIILTYPDGSTETAFTDESGEYAFKGLESGIYEIHEQVKAGYEQVMPVSGKHIVSLPPHTILTGYNFGNHPTVFPVHNLDTGEDFPRIQGAIDDVDTLDGHNLQVDAGSYTENVEITKSVNLIGAGIGITSVMALDPDAHVFNITGVSGVSINGFSIIGGEKRGCGSSGGKPSAGLYLKNSNFSSIYDNEIIWCNSVFVGSGGIDLRSSHNNSITNNIISNNLAGIYLLYSDNNTIIDNIVSDNQDGIELFDSRFNNISDNEVKSNNYLGISVGGSSTSADDPNNNTVSRNIVSMNVIGIIVGRSPYTVLMNNTVHSNLDEGIRIHNPFHLRLRNNNMTNNTHNFVLYPYRPDIPWDAAYFDFDIDTSNIVNGKSIYIVKNAVDTIYDRSYNIGTFICVSCNNVTVRDLTLTNIGFGIFLYATRESRVKNVTTSSNYVGIQCVDCDKNIFTENKVSNNEYGVLLKGLSRVNTVANNLISKNEEGIILYFEYTKYPTNNVIVNNTISLQTSWAIVAQIPCAGGNKLYNNFFNSTVSIGGDRDMGLYLAPYCRDPPFSASTSKQAGTNIVGGPYIGGNFWANTEGSGISETCTDADKDGICDIKFSPAQYAEDLLPLAIPLPVQNLDSRIGFDTIQAAINDSGTLDGHTLRVESGIYIENVDIYKQLNILGAGTEITYVQAANPNTTVFLVRANNVNISGFTVKGATDYGNGVEIYKLYNSTNIENNSITDNYIGIYISYSNNNMIFNNTVILNGRKGIYLTNSDNNIISNNTVFSNQYRGIHLNSSDNNNVSNNTIYDTERGLNHIISSNNNILSNDIHDNEYGIFIISSNKSNIANNTIYNNNYGIYFGLSISYSAPNNNSILNNSLHDNDNFAILIYDTNNTLIKWNYLENNFPGGTSQAYDAGTNNTFINNYWSDWTTPDSEFDGIVDLPYNIDGDASNMDPYPLTPIIAHDISILTVSNPNGGETLTDTITIQWSAVYDLRGHSVTYSVYFSDDGGTSWKIIASNSPDLSFTWDTTSHPNGSGYLIKVVATCSEGLVSEDISDASFTIYNIDDSTTPPTTPPTSPPTSPLTTPPTSPPTSPPTTTTSSPSPPSIPGWTFTLFFIAIGIFVAFRRLKQDNL